MATVILVDHQPLALESATSFLRIRLPEIVVEGLESLDVLRQRLEKGPTPDLVIMDYTMPGSSGTAVLGELAPKYPETGFAVFSGRATREEALACLRSGARGFLSKGAPVEEFVAGISAMLNGGVYLPEGLFKVDVHPFVISTGEQLTQRELEVLRLLRDGHSNKVIARQMNVEEVTVKVHVSSLLRKYGVDNRTALALKSASDLVFRG